MGAKARRIGQPYSGYTADAGQINNSPDYRLLLIETVKRLAGDSTADRATLFDNLTPFLDDLDALDEASGDTPNQKINDYYKGALSGRTPWAIQLFLAWLCAWHSTHATDFYRATGLKQKIRKEYRPFTGEPGDIAAKRRKEEPKLRAAEVNPGPIVPSVPPSRTGGDALDLAGMPWDAPVRLPHPDGILGASFSRDGSFVVTGGKSGIDGAGVFVWRVDSIQTGDRKLKLAHHDNDVAYVMCSPVTERVAAAFEETAGIYMSVAKVARLQRFSHDKQITTITYSPDGERVVTASWDGTAKVWDALTGKRICTLKALVQTGTPDDPVVNAAQFSPDGSIVVLACSEGTISFWNAATGKKIDEISDAHEKTYGASSAVFSPDGALIATTGGADRLLRLWDAETKELRSTLGDGPLHKDDLWSAQFSRDGKRLVTASKDGWSFVWDLKKGGVVARLKHSDALYTAEFSPDGSQVLTACEDGCAYLWRIA